MHVLHVHIFSMNIQVWFRTCTCIYKYTHSQLNTFIEVDSDVTVSSSGGVVEENGTMSAPLGSPLQDLLLLRMSPHEVHLVCVCMCVC